MHALNSIGDLNTASGNYHNYNKKVIFASIGKNSERYKWRLAIQCYPLQKDKEYTLCLEILSTDYQLWHKSVITVDTTTSQGVTVQNWQVNKYSHEYKTSSNQVEYMYYYKLVVTFSKTASPTPYFPHIQNIMAQAGTDLNTYPNNFDKYYLIAYGILGETMDLDPNKTYNYHTAFDIQPTRVVYNVDLDMSRQRIFNIAPDRSRNNSAPTVRMVKDEESLISKSLYEEIFDQVFDISDVKSLKIVQKVSGVVISGFVGMSFPEDKLLSDYQTDAGITLHGPCFITLTKPRTINSHFAVSCVIYIYYENTSNVLLKITQAISSLTAQFIVINNTLQIRAGT